MYNETRGLVNTTVRLIKMIKTKNFILLILYSIIIASITGYISYSEAERVSEEKIHKMSDEFLWNLDAITLSNISIMLTQTENIRNNDSKEFFRQSCDYIDSFITRISGSKYGKSENALSRVKEIQQYVARMKEAGECK